MPLDFVVSSVEGVPNQDRSLLVSTPWVSQNGSEYPIDVELVLRRKAEVEKIELIAHNIYIPRKVEILTKTSNAEHLIGEVEFRKNKSSPDKFEMKNIFLEEKCSKILFRIAEAHINVNDNPQVLVGLESVKLYGKFLADSGLDLFDEKPHIESASKSFSAEIETFIQGVKKNKTRYVANEDFKMAKEAQVAFGQLVKAKKEMEELERDKREAVDEEDFERAEELQQEIKALRSNVLAVIDPQLLDNALETSEPSRPKNLFSTEEKTFPPQKPKLFTPLDLSPTQVPADPDHSFFFTPPRKAESSQRSTSSRRVTNKFLEKENMIVPAALRRRSTAEKPPTPSKTFLRTDMTEDELLASIPPKDRPNVHSSIASFGISTMRKIYSKSWESRKDGISEVYERLQRMTTSEASGNFECINFLMSHLLKDPLLSVFKDALSLLAYVCDDWMPRAQLEKFYGRLATETYDILAQRVAQSSNDKRAIKKTVEIFEHICRQEAISKAYSQRLLSGSSGKNERGRALLIETLAQNYSIPNNSAGLQEKPLASFAARCIRNPDQQVRMIGKQLLLRLYDAGSTDAVRHELQKFSNEDSNNPTYRRLLDEIHTANVRSGKIKKKISFKF
ncbi:unnamed protein product [Caenorhabditis auriculariae]|uniref:UVR domain-containing protein n=1 Tax=Caenorhabditis auriculariae TaxID=2777116 RepID=A0A8S1HGT8_9PELO|nr:unnamed protein product [Caenorhabditis auriculariae]